MQQATTFHPRRPFLRYSRPSRAEAPPSPPVAHVTAVDRAGMEVVRFTFDTVVEDLGGCGDLRVNGNPPSSATLVDDFTVDAAYAGLPAGPAVWATESIDNEPIFAGGATIATDSGPVPPWV